MSGFWYDDMGVSGLIRVNCAEFARDNIDIQGFQQGIVCHL
jgi:hypothetical protein